MRFESTGAGLAVQGQRGAGPGIASPLLLKYHPVLTGVLFAQFAQISFGACVPM